MNPRVHLRCPECILFGATALALGCAEPHREESSPAESEAQSTAVESPDSIHALIDSLGQVEGTFVRAGGSGAWQFDGNRAVLSSIVELEERAVPALVDCLTNAEPTRVTVETRPVPLGVMCYEALHLTVSYEHTGPDGGLDPDWPGYVEPTAQSEDLVRAKQAWLDVVGSKAYRIP